MQLINHIDIGMAWKLIWEGQKQINRGDKCINFVNTSQCAHLCPINANNSWYAPNMPRLIQDQDIFVKPQQDCQIDHKNILSHTMFAMAAIRERI